jgi:hypothetical protein
LDHVVARFGTQTFSDLRRITHKMPAYDKAWQARGARDAVPMDFTDFFEGDSEAIAGVRDDVVENSYLRHAIEER